MKYFIIAILMCFVFLSNKMMGQGEAIEIIEMAGSMILSKENNANDIKINTNHVSASFYWLRYNNKTI